MAKIVKSRLNNEWVKGRRGEGEKGRVDEGEKRRMGDLSNAEILRNWKEVGLNEKFIKFVSLVLKQINMEILKSHKEIYVYQIGFKTSMEIFRISKSFPKEEVYSLTSQIRRSSRSVSANIAEAFRKRRYEKAFIAKLSDSEAEAAESQVWLDYSLECGYITEEIHSTLFNNYENIIGKIVNMIHHPEKWSI